MTDTTLSGYLVVRPTSFDEWDGSPAPSGRLRRAAPLVNTIVADDYQSLLRSCPLAPKGRHREARGNAPGSGRCPQPQPRRGEINGMVCPPPTRGVAPSFFMLPPWGSKAGGRFALSE